MPQNKITFGLRNVHYSIATIDSTGAWSFATPVALPGAQEFSSEVVGGSTNVYADDTLYASLVQNAGRTLTLKFTEIPDNFKTDILGYKQLANGNLVEIANAPVVTFALGFEFQGDAKSRRVWYYLCNVTPISEATKSKADSIEANSVSLTITARPIEVGDDLVTNCVASKGDSNYTNFLTTAPVIPTIPTPNQGV
ncbi:MAG: phage tail protein [Bacilli bacterium]|nr:phage tail protein [Bacilli bacterium]